MGIVKLNDEKMSKLIELYKQELSFSEIADKTGVDENVITRATYKTRKIDSNSEIK